MDTDLLFENDDWTVTGEALEHKASGYAIGREQLGRRRSDGFWAWPPHILEKNWVAPEAFAEAFSAAARLFGLREDEELALTFADAGLVPSPAGWRLRTAEVVMHPAHPAAGETAAARRAEPRRRRG